MTETTKCSRCGKLLPAKTKPTITIRISDKATENYTFCKVCETRPEKYLERYCKQ